MSDPLEGTGYRTIAGSQASWTYEAEQLSTGRRVAARFLPKEILADPELADRLRLEAQIIGRLAHPNVRELIELGLTRDGFPFLVTERPPGRTLAAELAERRTVGAEQAVSWTTQALAGLSAAHASGVVHRDVRPEVLYLREGAEPRTLEVTGFGVAPLIAAATPAAMGGDWARYLSPEQALGHVADERADIYAMGLVLYQMLVGADPYADRVVPIDLLRAHATEPPTPPSRRSRELVPQALEDAILRALAKRPEDRWACARDFGEALARAMGPQSRLDLRALIRTELTPGTRASTSLGNPSLAELARRIVAQGSVAPSTERSALAVAKPRLPETVNMGEGMPLPAARAEAPEASRGSGARASVVAGLLSAGLATAVLELLRAVLR